MIREKYEKIKYEISIIYEILDSNLENKLKFALLTLFKVLELLTDIYYNETGNKGAHAKISSILVSINEENEEAIKKDVSKLVCTRNGLIHSDGPREECQDNIKKPLDTGYIIQWFKTIKESISKLHNKENNK